jgi:nucleotide-binding universal stress UspA family protein
MSILQGKRLLCATDLSHPDLNTERVALTFAKQLGCSLTFVHVLEDAPLFLGPMPFEEGQKWEQLETRYRGELLAQTQMKAEKALSVLHSEGEHFQVHVKLGNAENEILGILEAEEKKYGAVIIGRHHHARLYTALFGSVAQRIAEQSPIPVVILPISEKKLPLEIKNIGLATALRPDTQLSEALLREFLAADSQRKIVAHIAHCFERVAPGYSGFETTDAYSTYRELEMIYDMAESRLERAVQERARLLTEEGYHGQGHLLVGHADEELLNFVVDNKIDLMIFGRHAEEGAHRFHLGRMVNRFLRKATCLVVVG